MLLSPRPIKLMNKIHLGTNEDDDDDATGRETLNGFAMTNFEAINNNTSNGYLMGHLIVINRTVDHP